MVPKAGVGGHFVKLQFSVSITVDHGHSLKDVEVFWSWPRIIGKCLGKPRVNVDHIKIESHTASVRKEMQWHGSHGF